MGRELERMKQRSLAKVEIAKSTLHTQGAALGDHLGQIGGEYGRVTDIAKRAPAIIEDLDKQFKEKTKLSDSDIAFLFLCTALQCARQYLLTNDKLRLENQGSLKSNVRGERLMKDIYQGSVGQIAPPKWENVLFQPVPYDVTNHSIHVNEVVQKIGGSTHRYLTLGHDPILGWVFGTANIMTSSLTKSDFVTTYQISHNEMIRHYPLGTLGMLNRAGEYAQSDPKLLAASVARQAIHYGSDYFTRQGLPVPFLGTLNPELAKRLMCSSFKNPAYIDMWSITRGAVLAALINQLIAVIHRLFYQEDRDGSETMYEVRTRKILSYSNALAVGSNVVVTAFTKDLSKLDVGGMLVALYRFISDYQFIQSVKRDFLKDEIYNMVVGKPYDFMEG